MERQSIVITDEVMKLVGKGNSVNDALSDLYEEEILARKSENEIFKNMTPMQMALYDAKVTKQSNIGKVIENQATISTQGASQWLVPAFIDTTLQEFINKNDILSYVVKNSVSADSTLTQYAFLDMNDKENRKNAELARVAEGSDLPLAVLKTSESGIRLYKHGRAVAQTYEAMLTMRVDMFTRTLDHIANDASNQELRRAIRVALKGDGNKNPATELKLGEYTDDLGLQKALSDIFVDYSRSTGVPVTTIVAGGDTFKKLTRLAFKTDTNSGADARYVFRTPQYPNTEINLVDSGEEEIITGASDKSFLLLNNNYSLTKHILQGSQIREYSQNILNQTKLGTISEIAGFSKAMPDGVKFAKLGK